MTSAAGASGGGGDAGPAVNGGPAQGEGGGEAFDASAAFNELKTSQADQQRLLEQLMGQGAEETADDYGDPNGDGDYGSELDYAEGDYDGAQDVDLNELAQQLGEHASGEAQRAIEPIARELQRQLSDIRDEQGWHNLSQEFPEMGDKEMASQVLNLVGEMAASGAIPGGQKAITPHTARLCYLALKGLEAAQAEEEQGDSPDAAHLEGGSGASPGGKVDLGAEILAAGPGGGLGKNVLDFGG